MDEISQKEFEKKESTRQKAALIEEGMDEKEARKVMQDAQKNKAHIYRGEIKGIQREYEYLKANLDKDGKYYNTKVNGYDWLLSKDLDAMSDKDVIELRKQLRDSLGDKYFDFVSGNYLRRKYGDRDSKSSDEEERRKEVEKNLEEFIIAMGSIKQELESVKASLVLDSTDILDSTFAVRNIDKEFTELRGMADSLTAEMDNFKSTFGNVDFSMSQADVANVVEDFKLKLVNLKKLQISKYNARVVLLNKEIAELKALSGLDPEVTEMINKLDNLSRCDTSITSFKDNGYLNELDYKKIVDLNNLVGQIKQKLGKKIDPMNIDFEADINEIERQFDELSKKVGLPLEPAENKKVLNEITALADYINAIVLALECNKDKLAPEKYEEYKDRLNDVQIELAGLTVNACNAKDATEYFKIKNKLEMLDVEAKLYGNTVSSLAGKVDKDWMPLFEIQMNTFDARIEDIKKEVEERHTAGVLDDTQYKALKQKISELENTFEKIRNDAKKKEFICADDIFSVLNNRIDGLTKALDNLEKHIDDLNKPISKKDRKEIDLIIQRLEQEIKLIEDELEHSKEEDPQKYEELKKKLDVQKERLDSISKKYRKKCPLFVKGVKSAKDFFKKHKKLALIAVGLAVIAIIHATVGPILIPAIMQGNIMVAQCSPLLREVFNGLNRVLGSFINASLISGKGWVLANGVLINPSIASTSLLKGLAISGIGTASIVAPIIVGIKNLINKVNSMEKKATKPEEKPEEKQEEQPEEQPEKKDDKKKKEKLNDLKNKLNKKVNKDFEKLFEAYMKSGKSLDDFCKDEEVTEVEKAVLEGFERLYEEKASAGRGGRK